MPTPTPRLVVLGFAGLGVTAALAGCAAGGGGQGGAVDTSAEYADGTYEAEGDYVSPRAPRTSRSNSLSPTMS